MSSVMKRISMVVLLSTALVLVSGQAQAEAKGARNALQRLSGKVVEVMGRESTLCIAFGATCVFFGGVMAMNGLGFSEHPLVLTSLSLASLSGVVFVSSAILYNSKQNSETIEAVLENIVKRKEHRQLMIDAVNKLAQEGGQPGIDLGLVEVNDFENLLNSIFERITLSTPIENAEALIQALPRIDLLVEENGSFPLTVSREGVTFNNGVFASYEELFGEGNFRHRTREETSEEVLDAADD